MRVIVCLDDNSGMLFNNRRQSRDRVLLADVIEDLGDKMLYVAPFSQMLFSQYGDKIIVDENFLEKVPSTGVCFAENCSFSDFFEKISEVTVYKWNRVYPTDFKCDIDFSDFKVANKKEFKGSSHEKITKLSYVRL